VKPVIHLIGLGTEGVEMLTLQKYRMMTKADSILVWSKQHPAVADLIREGFPCVELFSSVTEENDFENWGFVVRKIESHLENLSDIQNVVLTFPGNPLQEGKMIKVIHQSLADRYLLNFSLLERNDSLERLTAIMAELRSARGCPWDRDQSHLTLKKYLIEEAYEVLDAIDAQDMNNLCEELGDLLLQVVFHSQIASEGTQFSLGDVIKGISDKLIRRHPHVFSTVIAHSSEDVIVHWDAIKKKEKSQKKINEASQENFFSIPKGLPALMMAEKTQKKAAKIGFDWDDVQGPLAKIQEEFIELQNEADNKQRQEEELGDLLFSIVNLSRFLDVNAEEALRKGTSKFQKRVTKMMEKIEEEKREIGKLSLQELESYWNKVKKEEKYGTFGSF